MGVQQDKTVDVLLQARVAYERGDWVLAFDQSARGRATLVRRTPWPWRRLPICWAMLTMPFALCRSDIRTGSGTGTRWEPCASPSGLAWC